MSVNVGSTCRFAFTAKFATLNGDYRVRVETTFTDALASGIDFVENLYTPAGLSKSDFTTDRDAYLNDQVFVLESVLDASVVYYVPQTLFLTIPDPTIREFMPLILVVNLGVQANTQAVLPLLDEIKDLIQSNLGTTDPLRVLTNPQNKTYLTQGEYDLLVAAREANIKATSPLSVQLKEALDANTYLAALVAQYEDAIRRSAAAAPASS